jgi:hypothetical protein
MNAGRELDALIAEKVMGYTLRFAAKAWTDEDWMCSDTPTETNVMAIYAPADQFPGSGAFDMSIPHYSTDIAAAWQVIDRMEELVRMARIGRVIGGWECRFVQLEDTTGYYDVLEEADTAPLAICLAALKVCGVEV